MVGGDDYEITQEMLDAGRKALREHRAAESDDRLVKAVFQAMIGIYDRHRESEIERFAKGLLVLVGGICETANRTESLASEDLRRLLIKYP